MLNVLLALLCGLSSCFAQSSAVPGIPKIVHFIFGLKGENPTLNFEHYLAIKSAHDVLQPQTIYMHYHYTPVGENWEKVKPFLTLNRVEIPSSIFGQSVKHYAHAADVIRLEMLIKYGGIYMDIDVITVKPMDDLLNHDFVMGAEGKDGSIGLCNAVILAKSNSKFLKLWYEEYRTFDGSKWNYHSVILPGIMAKKYPELIHILPYNAFFWPLWNTDGLREMYLKNNYDYPLNNYAVHLWETASRGTFLKNLSLSKITDIESSIVCQFRKILGFTPLCDDVKLAKKAGLVGHWHFDETSGSKLIDSSGSNLNGALSPLDGYEYRSEFRQRSDDSHGSILSFNGNGDHAFIPGHPSLNFSAFSIAFWVRFPNEEVQEWRDLISIETKQSEVVVETHFINFDGIRRLELSVYDLRDNVPKNAEPIENWLNNNSAINLHDKNWHHIALTTSVEEGSLKLYVDGKFVSQSKWYSSMDIEGIWLGTRSTQNYRAHDSLTRDCKFDMDSLMIFNQVLYDQTIDFLSKQSHRNQISYDELDKSILQVNQLLKFSQSPFDRKMTVLNYHSFAVNSKGFLADKSGLDYEGKITGDFGKEEDSIVLQSHERPCYIHTFLNKRKDLLFLHMDEFSIFIKAKLENINQNGVISTIFTLKTRNNKHLSFEIAPGLLPALTTFDDFQSRTIMAEQRNALASNMAMNFVFNYRKDMQYGELYANGLFVSGIKIDFPFDLTELTIGMNSDDNAATIVQKLIISEFELRNYPLTIEEILVRSASSHNAVKLSLTENLHPIQACRMVNWKQVHPIEPFKVDEKHESFVLCVRGERLNADSAILWASDRDVIEKESVAFFYDENDHVNIISVTPVCKASGSSVSAINISKLGLFLVQKECGNPFKPLVEDVLVNASFVSKVGIRYSLTPIIFLSVAIVAYMIRGGGKNRATFTRVVVFLGILWTVFLLVSSIPQKSFVIAKEYQAERPFISVIVPAYNQEKYLSEAINSIIHQTYSNWEMIIVDDGSPDMSYDLALNVKATYPHLRISVLKKQNGGLSSARNYGIDRAKGQWICALDSDDYLHEQYLEKVAKTIVENPDVRLVYSNQQFFGDSTWQWDIPQYSHKRLLSEGLFPVQTVYRKVDWLAAGKYTEILPWGNEDWNLWISISSLGDIKAIKIPEYLNFYRFKQKSMQRDMAAFQEVVPMLHMMHIAEFQSTQIVKDHEVILSTYRRETHELLKKKAQKVSHYMIDLWLGMYEEKEGNNEAAIALYQSSLEKQKQQNQDFMMDWQIMWRFAIVKQKLGQMSGRKDCFLLAEKFSFLRAVLPKCLLT